MPTMRMTVKAVTLRMNFDMNPLVQLNLDMLSLEE